MIASLICHCLTESFREVQQSNKVFLSTPATQAMDLRISGTVNFTPPCICFAILCCLRRVRYLFRISSQLESFSEQHCHLVPMAIQNKTKIEARELRIFSSPNIVSIMNGPTRAKLQSLGKAQTCQSNIRAIYTRENKTRPQ